MRALHLSPQAHPHPQEGRPTGQRTPWGRGGERPGSCQGGGRGLTRPGPSAWGFRGGAGLRLQVQLGAGAELGRAPFERGSHPSYREWPVPSSAQCALRAGVGRASLYFWPLQISVLLHTFVRIGEQREVCSQAGSPQNADSWQDPPVCVLALPPLWRCERFSLLFTS